MVDSSPGESQRHRSSPGLTYGMKVAAVLAAVALTGSGCGVSGDLDKVMGRVDGEPVAEPEPERKIDCDLIFPGIDRR